MLAAIEISTGLLGFFLAIPLIAMTGSRPANLWLGLFILSVSLLSLAFPMYSRFPALFGLFDWPLASVGPFFYCYVRSVTGLGNSLRQRWHFVPLALLVVALLYGRSQLSGPDLLGLLLRGSVFSMALLAFQVLAAGYALAALYRLSQYRQRLREHYSSIGQRDLIWLSWLSIIFIALLIIWIPSNLLGGFWSLLLILGRLITLYLVGWFGLRQTAVFMSPIGIGTVEESSPAVPAGEDRAAIISVTQSVASAEESPFGDPVDVGGHKYSRSGMTDAASHLIGQRLAHWAVHECGYRDPDIKLSDLAGRIGTSPQLLSQYLNDVLGMNFFGYINGLRVAEIHNMMRDPGNEARTLLDLAFAAGFNSKSTFNASFKKISGLAPSCWRRLHGWTSAPIGQDVAASASGQTSP